MVFVDSKAVEINFGGKLKEIDADVLIESLVSYSSVAQEYSSYLAPKSKVNIKIKATKEGSFTILLNLIAEGAETIFEADNLNYAATLVGLIADLYTFRKWIAKNGKPEKIRHVEKQKVEVSNNKNSTIIIDNRTLNLYQDSPRIRDNLRKTFARLKEAKEIDSFSIKDEDQKELFSLQNEEFEPMSSDKDEAEQRRQTEVKNNQELSVFKVVFVENYKWEFFHKGNKIFASLKDEGFFDKIEKGEVAFRSGDKLMVDLEIHQVFNEAANTFVNDYYVITKVIEHIPRSFDPSQTQIEIEDVENES